MNQNPRPLSVIACLYIAVGTIGFVYHFRSLAAADVLRAGLWIELVRALAVVAGVFLLLGRNWARWLAVAWIAFHVAISVYGPVGKLTVHAVFLVAIAWVLFKADAGRYFRPPRVQPL